MTPDLNKYGVDRNVLRNLSGAGRKFKTISCFYETNANEATEPAPYYLGSLDVPGKVSVRQIYMDAGDLSDYTFAMELVGVWEHWEAIRDSSWFKPYHERYRAELEAKIRSQAIARYAEAAKKGEPTALKWFADKAWTKGSDEGRGKGRPSKAEKERRLNEMAQEDRDAQAALRRMNGEA